MSTMITQQKKIYDRIMKMVEENRQGLFIYLWLWRSWQCVHMKGYVCIIKVKRWNCSNCHIKWHIYITISWWKNCTLKVCHTYKCWWMLDMWYKIQRPLADLIRHAKLTIWDITPMMHKHYFEPVDRTLQDIMHKKNPIWWKSSCVRQRFSSDTSCYTKRNKSRSYKFYYTFFTSMKILLNTYFNHKYETSNWKYKCWHWRKKDFFGIYFRSWWW